jgi:hypothetical protein
MVLLSTLTLRRGPEDNTYFGNVCCHSSTEKKNRVYVSISITVISVTSAISAEEDITFILHVLVSPF